MGPLELPRDRLDQRVLLVGVEDRRPGGPGHRLELGWGKVALGHEERVGHQVRGPLVKLVEVERHAPMIDEITELLIVGGLTIDRFPDGSTAPGGSVIHSGAAAIEEGVTPSFLTVAGREPAAKVGLARLGEMGPLVHQEAPATTTFRHEERLGRRVLILEAPSGSIDAAGTGGIGRPDVALLAPIADELPADRTVAVLDVLRPRLTVLLIQGWLRHLEIGEEVRPLPLDAVPAVLWATFGAADALVVSSEDLAEAPGDPFAQAAALRARLGSLPVLVLTLGTEGYLLDDPAADRVMASVPRRVVEGVPMVGAGDTFGVAFAIHLGRGVPVENAATAATERVIRVLERRA